MCYRVLHAGNVSEWLSVVYVCAVVFCGGGMRQVPARVDARSAADLAAAAGVVAASSAATWHAAAPGSTPECMQWAGQWAARGVMRRPQRPSVSL